MFAGDNVTMSSPKSAAVKDIDDILGSKISMWYRYRRNRYRPISSTFV